MKRKFPNRVSKPQVCKIANRPTTLLQIAERMNVLDWWDLPGINEHLKGIGWKE